MQLPYYAAFFQGEDFIINVSVDVMKTAPNDPHGFIVWLWIKYKNYEWLINLEDQTIEYKNNSQELTKEQSFKFNGNDISCLLYTSPSPRDKRQSRMPSSA